VHLRTRAVASATCLLLFTGAGAALADVAQVDGDLTTTGTVETSVAFGAVPCNADSSIPVGVWATRQGSTSSPNVWASGAVLTASAALAPDSTGVVAGSPSGQITLPGTWTSASTANGTKSTAVSLPLTVHPTASGSYTASVVVTLSGTAFGGGTNTRTSTLTVTWSTACPVTPPAPTNTAPTAPGTPAASAAVTKGGFLLSWPASADNQNDAVSYTVQGRDADDAGWSEVVSGLSSPSYQFPAGTPAEGTWTYRVRAVETSTPELLASAWSETSSPVVVDRKAPNAPSAAADRDPEYSAGGTDWWKDTVTVTFTGNGDPNLPDGSAGSGVESVTSPPAFSTQGPFTAEGRATDFAGNESAVTTLSGSVDTQAPVLSATCPTGPFIKDSAVSVGWSASDEGGSGVTGDASGTVAFDTSTVGPHEAVVIPAVKDNVGHESNTITCDAYEVHYSFAGFFKPVALDPAVYNVAKAGSAIPLKFSLGGDQTLDILKTWPTFVPEAGSGKTGDPVDYTVFAASSALQYDATAGQYIFVWKTDKAWAGQSGTITLELKDGTQHSVKVTFTR
jgi:hypothetical protein